MKRTMIFLVAIITMAAMTGCKKNDLVAAPLASVNVVNVVVDGKYLKMGSYKFDSALVNNYKVFMVKAGESQVYLYPAGDSLKPYYANTIPTVAGDIYSLFLTGDAGAVQSVLIKETAIPWYVDSLFGVRFANMSTDNVPIRIVQAGTPTKAEFDNIAYKEITAFKEYPAKLTQNTYTFQVRHATTDALLATYSLATPRFHGATLVWKGKAGGSGANAPGILRMNHY